MLTAKLMQGAVGLLRVGEHYIGLLYSYVGNVWDSACHCVLSQSLLLLLGEGCAGGWRGRYSKTFQRMDYNRFPEAGSRF